MATVTIRNIPESILEQIKALSALERRSMNSEILVLLEQAVRLHHHATEQSSGRLLSPETQTAMWRGLSGKWQDERSAEEIIEDIYENRTAGRNVDL
jgi:hypothetical protein